MYQKVDSHTNTQRRQSATFNLHCYWRKPMIYRAIQKRAVLLQCDLTQSMFRRQSTKSMFILSGYYEHQTFRGVSNTNV